MAALYNSKLSELIPYYLRRRTDELTKAWGTDKGIYFDINKAGELYSSIKEFTPLTAEQEVILATLPPACQNEVRDANNQLLKTLEANKRRQGSPSTKLVTSAMKSCFHPSSLSTGAK